MYKLTFPCKKLDTNGHIMDAEQTVMFDSKENLVEYLSGDRDGDNYGSALLRILKYDAKLYTQVGKMCNHIVQMLEMQDKERHTAAAVCRQIVNYMVFSSLGNAEKLYSMLHETRVEFLSDYCFEMIHRDIDGDRPYAQEWCDNFVTIVRSNPRVFVKVLVYSARYDMDERKEE